MFMQRTASLTAICGTLAAAGIFSVYSHAISVAGAFQGASAWAQDLIARGYDVAPALMMGLVLLAAVPLIAVMSPIVFHVIRPEAATQRYRPRSGGMAVPGDTHSAGIIGDQTYYPGRAYVEVAGIAGNRYAIARDMLRIGREDDNDIRMPSKHVHRYHAAIYREHHDDWLIADLSGNGGNGVRVNGQVCTGARLKDGDIIEVGPSRLRFRAARM